MELPGTGGSALLDRIAAVGARAAGVQLPSPLLEGWSSPSAVEYAAAVVRLAGLLRDIRNSIATAQRAIPPP